MAIDVKPILRAGIAMQSLAIVSDSYRLARKKKRRVKDYLGTFATTATGIPLISAQGNIVEGM